MGIFRQNLLGLASLRQGGEGSRKEESYYYSGAPRTPNSVIDFLFLHLGGFYYDDSSDL